MLVAKTARVKRENRPGHVGTNVFCNGIDNLDNSDVDSIKLEYTILNTVLSDKIGKLKNIQASINNIKNSYRKKMQ